MNILSLRVSTMRGNENLKKNSEVRMERLQVSAELLDKFKDDPVAHSFLMSLNASPGVEDQVNQVRGFQANADISADSKRQLFVAIYLVVPLKHAVRGAVVKIFQSCYKNDSDLDTTFEDQLRRYLAGHKDLPDWRSYFPVISTITGLFENINITRTSAMKTSDTIYAYLLEVLQTVSGLFYQSTASPSLTNEILLLNHNVLRVLLALCQEFGGALKDRHCDFGQLTTSLETFLAHPDVPMDTKTNCGHLTVILCKLTNCYGQLLDRKLQGRTSFCENVGIVVDIDRGEGLLSCNESAWAILNLITVETRDHAQEHSKQQYMVLACSRLIMRISKVLPQLPKRPEGDQEMRSMVGNLVDFVFAHMENFMDSVRHMSRDSLKMILTFCLDMNIDSEVSKLFHRIHEGCSKNVRFITLACIASVYGTKRVFLEIPQIVDELIEHFKENSFDVSAGNCYEVLMLEHKKEEEVVVGQWIELWMSPLIKFLNELPTSDQNTKIVVETLISKAVKNDQEVIRVLIQSQQIPINIRLTVLSMAKKCGKLACDNNAQKTDLWKGSIATKDLKQAMVHFDDRVRVQSLKLVIDTLKITEPYEPIDLELMQFFYKYNVNCQSPATRDQIMALFRQCFIKFSSLLASATKKKDVQALELNKSFLLAVRTTSFENLRLNGNFTRRNMSLTFIDQICATLHQSTNDDNSLESPSEAEVDSLVSCFADSYECNKVLAMNVLRKYCNADMVLLRYSNLDVIRPLITGVHPGDSTTAAYNLQLIVCLAQSNPELYTRKLFVTVQWLVEIVEEGIQLARSSLMSAAKKNPIYGAMLCIRHLLLELDVQTVKQDLLWRQLVSKLVRICFDASEAVKSIVNNSSPEGHLPNDLGMVVGTSPEDNVTAQMILLMGWRTIKEVSLLLGDISKYPLISDSNPGLVTVDEFFRIGDIFRELLAETKHRGAFEQAYVGFSKLCCRLWTAQEKQLHTRPMVWLEELMAVVTGRVEPNSKFCSTRRSAGVPFMVQALITSEIQVCSSRALRYSMDILFQLCESTQSTAEARTHALNILRALFRCTDLNDDVVEFVDRGIMAAITSFAGQTWPEKNSATLLFSALVIRIFGVQLTKDTEVLNVRNKMTGRIFFLRYPKLYDFFLRELESAQQTLSRNGRDVKLFPILLVLSRLYPSALEGTESSLSLHAFVERIECCSQCPEMKTRVLVGKSIASLLTSNLAWEYLQRVLASYATSTDLNVRHSKLLIVQQVLSSPELKCESDDDVNRLMKHLVGLPINFAHWILTKAYLEIFVVTLQRFKSRVNRTIVDVLVARLTQLEQNLLSHRDKAGEMGYVETLSPFVVLQLQLHDANDTAEIVSTILHYLALDAFQEAALGVTLLIMNEDRQDLPDDLELTKWEQSFVGSVLPSDVKGTLKQQLGQVVRIPQISQEIVVSAKSSYDLRNKALALLAYFPKCKAAGHDMQEEEDESSHNIDSFERVRAELLDASVSYQARAATYKWYLRNCARLGHALPLSVVEQYSSVDNTFNVRLTSTEIMKEWPIHGQVLGSREIVKYISVVLLLLRDDDAEVRESMVRGLACLGDSCCIELYAQEVFLTWIATELVKKRGTKETVSILSELVVEIQRGQQQDLSVQVYGCTAEEETSNNEEGRVFDRNDANQFAEIHVVIADIQNKIQRVQEAEDIELR